MPRLALVAQVGYHFIDRVSAAAPRQFLVGITILYQLPRLCVQSPLNQLRIDTLNQHICLPSPERLSEPFFQFGDAIRCKMLRTAIRQNTVCLQYMRTRAAVDERMRAAGVIADHSADTTAVAGRGLGTEEQPVRLTGYIQFIAYHTGLNHSITICRIDLDNAVHMPADVCHNAVSHHLSGDRCTTGARNEVRVAAAGFGDERTDVVFVLRVGNTVRYLTIHTGIRSVGYLMNTVG